MVVLVSDVNLHPYTMGHPPADATGGSADAQVSIERVVGWCGASSALELESNWFQTLIVKKG